MNLELTDSARQVVSQQALGILLPLYPQIWSYRCVPPHTALYVRAGDLTHILTVGSQALHWLILFPSTVLDFDSDYLDVSFASIS